MLVYKQRLLPDFWVNNGLCPQKTSVVTQYRVLPRLQSNLFTITSSPRKFAECLYCNVTPPPILPVLSRFIEFIRHVQLYSRTVIYGSYSHTNHINSYIHTIIHSYINTLIHQSFQVAGPNNRTTCILPFNFYHMPSGRFEQPGQLASPFRQSIIPNGKTEQPNSLRLPFYFYHISSRQS